MSKSQVMPVGCIARAMRAIEGKIGLLSLVDYSIKGERQRLWELFVRHRRDYDNIAALEGTASSNVSEVNQWLRQRNFPLTLQEQAGGPRNNIYAAATFIAALRWRGMPRVTEFDGYKFLRFDDFTHQEYLGQQLAVLDAGQDWQVYIIPWNENPPWSLLYTWDWVYYATPISNSSFDGVEIPFYNHTSQGDMEWLVGMNFAGSWYIAQAMYYSQLSLDQEGVAVRQAAALGMTRGAVKHYWRIDSPVVLWLTYKHVPVSTWYLGRDAWVRV